MSDIEDFRKAVSSHPFPWSTGSEWHCTVCERQSHHGFPYEQQQVSDITHLWKAVSSHLFLWPTGSEWNSTFCEMQSHHIFSYHHQQVSSIAHFVKAIANLITFLPMIIRKWVTLHILWKAVSSHIFLWPSASEWHCTCHERHFHHTFSYDQQRVSGIIDFVKGSLITSFTILTGYSEWHIL